MWHSADSVLSLCLEVFAGKRSTAGALEALVREDVRASEGSLDEALDGLTRAALQCALLDLGGAPVPFFPRLEVLATGQRAGTARAEQGLAELTLERCVPGIAELSQLILRHGLPLEPDADRDQRRRRVLDLLRLCLLWPPALPVLARAFDLDALCALAARPGATDPAGIAGCLSLPRPDPYRVRSVSLVLGDVLRASTCEGAGGLGLAALRASPFADPGGIGLRLVWQLFRHALVRVVWARKVVAGSAPEDCVPGALFWSGASGAQGERWDPEAFRRYGRHWLLDLLTETVQRRDYLIERQASVDATLLADDGFGGLHAEVLERVRAFRRASLARPQAKEVPAARGEGRPGRRRRASRSR